MRPAIASRTLSRGVSSKSRTIGSISGSHEATPLTRASYAETLGNASRNPRAVDAARNERRSKFAAMASLQKGSAIERMVGLYPRVRQSAGCFFGESKDEAGLQEEPFQGNVRTARRQFADADIVHKTRLIDHVPVVGDLITHADEDGPILPAAADAHAGQRRH